MKTRHVRSALFALSLLLGTGTFADAPESLHERATISLRSLTLNPETPPAVPSQLAASLEDAELYALVKFSGPVSQRQLDELERKTLAVYSYLPHDTFLVKLSRETYLTRTTSLGARWVGLFHPAYKISPTAAEMGSKTTSRELVPVLLQVYPDADLDGVVRRVRALANDASQSVPDAVVGFAAKPFFSRIRMLLSPSRLARLREDLARLPGVAWIDVEARRVLLNDTTAWVGQSGLASGMATPVHDQGILGQGQVIGVLDTGLDPDMCFFRDPSRGLPPRNECDGGTVVDPLQRKVLAVNFLWTAECNGGINGSEWDTHDHGTHVSGTAAGDDFANVGTRDAGDGMAPAAKLVIQDGGLQFDNCADLPGLGCPVVDLVPIFQQAYDQGVRIHNNSWGDQENAPVQTYSAASQDSDEFTWNNRDFLLVYAAGNSGPGSGTISSPSNGKNVLAVGATRRGTGAETMASFSSCGPTLDGRIKPDITIPGSGIVSANNDGSSGSNNCGTRTMSGTSMASPAAAGLAALVRQYFADGFYPSGAANAANALTSSAALTKAVLVHSARAMTGVGNIPSNCQGWGRILLDDTLYFSGDSRRLWARDEGAAFPGGSSGAEQSFTFEVAAGEPFKATLTWTDFPAAPAANPTLVNDLDLEVSGPGGVWKGNVFSAGQSTTGGSADRLNTVEQVLLASPTAGTYTVTVRSFTVPSGPQPFALVVGGDLVEPEPESIFSDGFEAGDLAAWTESFVGSF